MPRKPRYARISITLPEDVLAAPDRRAEALDRPRSWVVAEAIRSYRGDPAGQVEAPQGTAEVVEARWRRLLADLRLTPEERLRRAAALLRLAPRSEARPRAQVIGFDSYEEFAAWKKAHRLEARYRS